MTNKETRSKLPCLGFRVIVRKRHSPARVAPGVSRRTRRKNNDPVTEPRVFSQGAGMERVIDVPITDIEST